MKILRFKIVILLLIASVVSLLFYNFGWSWQESVLFSWICFALLYVSESLLVMIFIPAKNISKHAKEEDLGVWLQFVMLVIICSTALLTLISWNSEKLNFHEHGPMHIALFLASIILSWFVLHLSFTFRYAHLFYGDENASYSKHVRGLGFTNEEHPDYWDFAYYSFTVGMTFQVSDVTAKTKGIRRLTLVHALVSFLFNTILVAITINEVINL